MNNIIGRLVDMNKAEKRKWQERYEAINMQYEEGQWKLCYP